MIPTSRLRALLLSAAVLLAAACGEGSGAPGAVPTDDARGTTPSTSAGNDDVNSDGNSDVTTTIVYDTLPPQAGTVAENDGVVHRYVLHAPGISEVPSDLAPALAELPTDTEGTFDLGCLPQPREPRPSGDCEFGDTSSDRTLVLYGDSHASMWLPAFDEIGRRRGLRVLLLSKPGCPGPSIDFWDLQNERSYPECEAFHDHARVEVDRVDAEVVVATSAYIDPRNGRNELVTTDEWSAAVVDMLDGFGERRTVVLGDIPSLPNPTPECLSIRTSRVQDCGEPVDVAVRAEKVAADRAGAERGGADYVGVTDLFCTEVCSPIVGNIAVYRDEYHASTVYVRWLTDVIEERLFGG